MPVREQVKKAAPVKAKPAEEIQPALDAEAQRLKDESDAMLDEIDSLLEENAQEFVANYIQKGGE